ncbi:hypothetical protein Poly51_17620 [Rubripirellula tenax]|uniref:Cytochrome c domain-containing protein n=1 Tax=Rubripirellula tenax TaxID=2528015 RepID=A0A5C6FHB3_9BACT|nr:hypothetical protein [Rubripirellula tenax]TWU58981.1 hypothetical protein Poly51_17620 [Rubripirellula tenax]
MNRAFVALLPTVLACVTVGADVKSQLTVDQMTIDEVQSYVIQNDVRSVEDLMAVLPPVMRKTFTLVEHSRSRQRPSSALFPRIIMFLPDGRFFMTIATNHKSRAYNDVEMLEFQDDKTWRLDLVRFPDGLSQLSERANVDYRQKLPSNESCTGCHGPNSRPIWGDYPVWPGVFADNAGQRLTERQARRLTEALNPRGGNQRLKLLDWRTPDGVPKRSWQENEHFDIPAYRDVPSPDLPNDAISARHVESIWSTMSRNPNKTKLVLAYLFLDQPDFLESVSPIYRVRVTQAKEKLRAFVDQEFANGSYEHLGNHHSDKALLLFGLDTYDDLYVALGKNDLNSDFEPHEWDIDRNFGAGGDDISAFIVLRMINDLIDDHPKLEQHFVNNQYAYPAYRTLNEYRESVTKWLWDTTVAERVAHLEQRRHLAGEVRYGHLMTDELQSDIVADLLQIVEAEFP